LSSCTWKRDEDEVQSAWLLLEEFKISSPDCLYTIELIPIEQDEDITVIVFVLPEILCQWGGHLHELQLDSACESSYCDDRNSIKNLRISMLWIHSEYVE
jgi:hypothetical protein